MTFTEWLLQEIQKADISFAEVARRGEISHARISQVVSAGAKPGADLCLGIARGLKIPPETVLCRAGILPSKPERTEQTEALLYFYDQLPPDQQRTLRVIARALVEDRAQPTKVQKI